MPTRERTRKPRPRPTQAACSAAMLLALAGQAAAQPSGASVASGSASFNTAGATTTITAANGTVINYTSFNIPTGHTVRFVQPSAVSTVLNRVNSALPTTIDGALLANGRVFLVNPSGIIFGAGAVINTGAFYAAAASISDSDFLEGSARFTDAAGSVVNHGTISGDLVTLFGASVENHGAIVAPQGSIVLAAGNDLVVGSHDGHVYAIVTPPTATPGASPAAPSLGVLNAGSLRAERGRVLLAASDSYGTAIWNTGHIRGQSVALRSDKTDPASAAPGGSLVRVSGTIDASSPDAQGGSVTIEGQRVLVDGATIDASGRSGGGTIDIGGSFRGRGPLRNAERVAVTETSSLIADATGHGSGGRIVVWSDQATGFAGSLTARGGADGGDGGFVEVSSAGGLLFQGSVNLLSRVEGYARGRLLLDPADLVVATGGTGSVADATFAFDPDGLLTIDPAAIVAALDGADVELQANNTITISDAIDASANAGSGDLTLRSGGSIFINADITLNGDFFASANDSAAALTSRDNAQSGVFAMAAGTTIDTSLAGGNITIVLNAQPEPGAETGDLTLASLLAGAGDVAVTHGGNAGSILAAGPTSLLAGANVSLQHAGDSEGSIGTAAAPIRTDAPNIEALGREGGIFFRDVGTTGTLTIGGSLLGLGLTTDSTGGQIQVVSDRDITVIEAIDAGAGVVRLQAVNSITQSAAGTITSGALAAVLTGTGPAGLIDLSLLNQVNSGDPLTTVVAFSNASTGPTDATVRFNNSQGFTLGTVAAQAGFNDGAALAGLSGGGPLDVTLASQSGLLRLDSALNAGTGAVRLQSSGDITQAPTAIITAGRLAVSNTSAASGQIVLNANNSLAADGASAVINGANAFATGALIIHSVAPGTLAIGSATAGAPGFFGPIAAGLSTNNGTIAASTLGGALSLEAPVNAGSGAVLLQSMGDITQSGAAPFGVITAGSLAAVNASSTTGSITLTLDNAIDAGSLGATLVAFRNANSSGTIGFNNANGATGLTVGALDPSALIPFASAAFFNSGNALAGVTGAPTLASAIITSSGPIALAQAVNLGTGLAGFRSTGGISQTTSGVITAGSLAVVNESSGSIVLGGANVIQNSSLATTLVALRNEALGGAIALNNTGALGLTIGSIAGASSFNGGDPLAGVSTADNATFTNDVTIATTGALAVNDAIDAGSGTDGATVRLQSGGSITQDADGTITAGRLAVVNTGTTGAITLDALNVIASGGLAVVAASNAAPGGEVVLRNTSPDTTLRVGSVGAGPAFFNSGAALTGVASTAPTAGTATNAISLINDSGALDLAEIVNAGAALLRLQAAGAITQSAAFTTGSIAVNQTSATAGIDVSLDLAGNVIDGGTLPTSLVAIRNNSAGGDISLRAAGDSGFAPFQAGSGLASFNGGANIVGVTTNSDSGAPSIALVNTTGDIFLAMAVTATAGSVFLSADGNIQQNVNGVINATNLGVLVTGESGNFIDLNGAANNVTGTFAARNEAQDGSVAFNSSAAYAVDTLAAVPSIVGSGADIVGVSTTDQGSIELDSDVSITLRRSIATSAADIVFGADLIIDADVTLSTRLTTGTSNGSGSITFAGDVLASADNAHTLTILTSNGGDGAPLGPGPVPVVRFIGDRLGTATERFASVLINADSTRASVPSVATITAGFDDATTPLTILPAFQFQVWVADTFAIGRTEALTVAGDLLINSAASPAALTRLGDLSILGDLNIAAAAIEIWQRPGGLSLPSGVTDEGGFVAVTGTIDLNGVTPTPIGVGPPTAFVTPSGFAAPGFLNLPFLSGVPGTAAVSAFGGSVAGKLARTSIASFSPVGTIFADAEPGSGDIPGIIEGSADRSTILLGQGKVVNPADPEVADERSRQRRRRSGYVVPISALWPLGQPLPEPPHAPAPGASTSLGFELSSTLRIASARP
ncbi:MAG: hypothetical protein C0513_00460 [Isosphaera sp.]|nr:hypothetical protein [Isosphaera sp.]